MVGIIIIVFNKSIAKFAIESQNKFWGLNFGEREMRNTRIIELLVGTAFVVFGVLSILKVLKSK